MQIATGVIDEQRIGVDVASAGPPLLYIAVTRRCYRVGVIEDFVPAVIPQNTVDYCRAAVDGVHSAAIVCSRVSAERAVRHRRAAAQVEHPAAAEDAGRVPAERAVGHRGAAAVVHPAAADGGRVPAERTVGNHRRADTLVGHPAAGDGRVSAERAVGHRQAAVHVVDPAAADGGRVAAERAVGHRQAAVEDVHPAAVVHGRVSAERAVSHRRAAVHAGHPAAEELGRVPGERAVGHRRAAGVVEHPTTASESITWICPGATRYREAVNDCIRPLAAGAGHHRARLLSVNDRDLRPVRTAHRDRLAEQVDRLVVGARVDLHLVTIHSSVDGLLNGRVVAGDLDDVGPGCGRGEHHGGNCRDGRDRPFHRFMARQHGCTSRGQRGRTALQVYLTQPPSQWASVQISARNCGTCHRSSNIGPAQAGSARSS